jgi:hypothetical protein
MDNLIISSFGKIMSQYAMWVSSVKSVMPRRKSLLPSPAISSALDKFVRMKSLVASETAPNIRLMLSRSSCGKPFEISLGIDGIRFAVGSTLKLNG